MIDSPSHLDDLLNSLVVMAAAAVMLIAHVDFDAAADRAAVTAAAENTAPLVTAQAASPTTPQTH